jgi:hypothetical protein
MKKLIILSSLLVAMSFTFSCENRGQNTENEDSTIVDKSQNTANVPSSENSITVTAKFVSAGSLEGDADLTFQKEDGSKIFFYRNYMSKDEPELKYELIGDDGASANPKLVGQTFVIKYKVNPKGRISMISGEGEPCNQILSIEKK